jgi:hypothetical protein
MPNLDPANRSTIEERIKDAIFDIALEYGGGLPRPHFVYAAELKDQYSTEDNAVKLVVIFYASLKSNVIIEIKNEQWSARVEVEPDAPFGGTRFPWGGRSVSKISDSQLAIQAVRVFIRPDGTLVDGVDIITSEELISPLATLLPIDTVVELSIDGKVIGSELLFRELGPENGTRPSTTIRDP